MVGKKKKEDDKDRKKKTGFGNFGFLTSILSNTPLSPRTRPTSNDKDTPQFVMDLSHVTNGQLQLFSIKFILFKSHK